MDVNIPGYQILRKLGYGGTAEVYLAIQTCLKREVALKVLRHIVDDNSEIRLRFQREGESIANLAHQHIVTIYDMGVKNNQFYIAMEHLSGETLRERIQHHTCTFAQKIKIITQISVALGHAHQKGYVHRDVKPTNILFHADGRAILTDFGITKLLHENSVPALTTHQTLMGTCQYMSPEQTNGNHRIDTRSDIYSLGIVFFKMLTGYPPYESENFVGYCYQHNNAPIPTLPAPWQRFQAIIDKTLAKHPDQRYQTTQDFTQDILAIAKTDTKNTNTDPSPPCVIPDNPYIDNKEASDQRSISELSINEDNHKFDFYRPVPTTKSNTKLWLGVGSTLAVATLIGLGYGVTPNVSPKYTTEQKPDPLKFTKPITEDLHNLVADDFNLTNSVVTAAPTDPIQSIESLLAQATPFIKTHQYAKAAEQYQLILEQHPGNTQAQQGIKTMTDQIVVLVNQALSHNNIARSLTHIDEGLRIMPTHRLLNQLKQIVTARVSE